MVLKKTPGMTGEDDNENCTKTFGGEKVRNLGGKRGKII